MVDILDKFFFNNSIKENINGMEKKKLIFLDEEGERYWKLGCKLESERNKLRNQLKPPLKVELDKLKKERDDLLQIKTEEAREIKEDRKAIRYDFYLKTKHIREKRKEQLSSDVKLSKNKERKQKVWEKHRIVREKFNTYWGHLNKKYSNEKQKEREE